MFKKPPSCSGCPLQTLGSGFCPEPEGKGSLGVLIVGEALGEQEAESGLPFRPYAEAGSVLERALRRLGYDREQFLLYNTVNCRPPGNKLEGARYEAGAIEHCRQYLDRVIREKRPRAIVALGSVATRALTHLAGRNKGILNIRGFVIDSPRYGLLVVPSVHPSFIRRGATHLLGVLMRDLQLAVQVAEHGLERPEVSYLENPTPHEAYAFLDRVLANPGQAVSYDIETDYSVKETDEAESLVGRGDNITQIQFSLGPRTGIVFPWQEPFIKISKQTLESSNPKWGWNNWNFDDRKLERYEIRVRGENHDLMWMWHHLEPDLPKNLQFVTSFYAPEMPPWKHLASSDMGFYGACDVDSVQRIGQRLPQQLKEQGIWEGYETYVRNYYPVLRRMVKRGLPVDSTEQLAFRERITEESDRLFAEIQGLIPDELRKVKPASGYVTPPKSLEGLVEREFTIPQPKLLTCASCDGTGKVGGKRPGTSKKCPNCKGTGSRKSTTEFEQQAITRWCRVESFSPASSPQLLDYARAKRHPLPVDRDGKPTTSKQELLRLGRRVGDPLYGMVIRWRELQKIASTYIDGWQLDEESRVHSTFGFGPATGQLSSRDPNIQNIPKHGQLAKDFRRCIRARDGYKLVEFDFTAFHALTLGFEARDGDYMRLARLDIHSYVAGHLLRLEGRDSWLRLPDRDLAATLASIKANHTSVRDTKAKPTILGYGFGLGAAKLFDMNRESFKSKAEAQGLIDLINRLFPRTAAYREDIRQEAHRARKLVTPHGFLRRFYDVMTWDSRTGGWRYGEDSEKVIAFRPANHAFGTIRRVMLECERKGYNERFGLVNTIHDSLLFECHNSLADSCIELVSLEMEAPNPLLSDPVVAPLGLRCGIEASIGQDWASLKTVYKTPLERLTSRLI